MSTLQLRPATKEDMTIMFEWANDPLVRESAIHTEQIEWEDHVAWFEKKLADDTCVIYIAEDEGTPVGQIRFDAEDSTAEVDLHLAPDARGKGYGSQLITEGTKKYFAEQSIDTIQASVKPENSASANAFLKAGFEEVEPKDGLLLFQLLR